MIGWKKGFLLSMFIKSRIILLVCFGAVAGIAASAGGYLLNERISKNFRAVNFSSQSEEQTNLLVEVLDSLREEYVHELDEARLVENAINGMLESLDNHSRFLSAEDYEGIRISATGQYAGVGLDISLNNGELKVVAPLDDTPAQRAGILPGDVLVSVNDVPVDVKDTEATIKRMRGEPGTQVTLELRRHGREGPLRFALTRSDIYVKTVRTEYLGMGYGYIGLTGFADSTADELERALRSLPNDNELSGVILDLRNNPGGVLDAAVAVADAFLDKGLIVRGGGRVNNTSFEEYAKPGDIFSGLLVTVLINEGSASASEIVAAALREHSRARLVGEQTYGKGSVQSVIPLSNGQALKLTTSHYFTPSGNSINGMGIKPDIVVVAENPLQLYRGPGSDISANEDIQLQEALRLMSSE